MSSERHPATKSGSGFSYGVRELRDARRAGRAASLEVADGSPPAEEARGFDPYNSSGSFDRRKNWERIRKR